MGGEGEVDRDSASHGSASWLVSESHAIESHARESPGRREAEEAAVALGPCQIT